MSAIFKTMEPDPIGTFLGTGYNRFTSKQGIDGLCRIRGHHLDLLAVFAASPGTGQFRRFMEACKEKYDSIAVWEIWNEDLAATLNRYNFYTTRKVEAGEECFGMLWKRPEEIDSPQ